LSITVLAHLPFRPDAMDEGMKVLEEILPDTRAFEGCLSLTVHRDQDAPH
jgi:quinol monooxygenase YgiN